MIFHYNFNDIGYVKFLITLLNTTYRILVWLRHLEVLKWFFLAILMKLVTSSFSLHYCYLYNFENHYWTLYIYALFVLAIISSKKWVIFQKVFSIKLFHFLIFDNNLKWVKKKIHIFSYLACCEIELFSKKKTN